MPAPFPRRILFVCSGNCVRSQMAEALLRYRAAGRFEAFSAGTQPAGFVHEMTTQVLQEIGVSTRGLRSKSFNEFAGQRFDAVITLCANARNELCAVWPLSPEILLPARAHWGFPDPAHAMVMGTGAHLEKFREARNQIRECVERLALAPDAILADDTAFAALVQKIAKSAPQRETE